MLLTSLTPLGEKPLSIGRLTVVVGETNAGKSSLLKDVARLMTGGRWPDPGPEPEAGGRRGPRGQVLENLSWQEELPRERLLHGLAVIEQPDLDAVEIAGLGPDLRSGMRVRLDVHELRRVLHREALTAVTTGETVLAEAAMLRVAHLDGRQAADVAARSPAGSPAEPPANALQALQFASPSRRQALEEAVQQWRSDLKVRLDDSERVELLLRLATEFPEQGASPRETALAMRSLAAIDDFGEGVRSLAGVAAAVLASEGRVILLDQPDALLHPRLARRLGRWLGLQAERLDAQIILATNERELLNGALESSDDVTVLRVSRAGGQTHVQAADAETTRALVRSSYVESSPALDSLFYDAAAAIDSHASLWLYCAAMRQEELPWDAAMVPCLGVRGLAEGLRLLRATSQRSCVIAHLDCLEDRQALIELIVTASGEPPLESWLKTRDHLARRIEAHVDASTLSASAKSVEAFLSHREKGKSLNDDRAREMPPAAPRPWDRLRALGWDAVPRDLRPWVADLIDDLALMGVFIAQQGRASGWFEWGPPSHGQESLSRAIELMHEGGCPDDLTSFLDRVSRYLAGS